MHRSNSTIILLSVLALKSVFTESSCEFSQCVLKKHESFQSQYLDFDESIYRAEIDSTMDHGDLSTMQSRNEHHNHTTSEKRWNVGNLNLTIEVRDVTVYVFNIEHFYVPLLVIIVLKLFRRNRANNDRLSRKTCGLDPPPCSAVNSVAVHICFSQDETLRPPCLARGGSPVKLCIGSAPILKLDVFVNGDCCEMRDRHGDS